MKQKIIRIYKEDDVNLNLKFIVKKLNNLVKNLTFEIGEVKIRFPNKRLNKQEKIPNTLTNKAIKNHTLIVLISDKQFEDNYFFHEIQNNVILLSFYQWENLTNFSKNTGLTYFISDFLSLELDNTERHHKDDITECIYNFSWYKTEIDKGIKSSIICEKCQERVLTLNDKEKQNLLDDIMLILEEIKKSIHFKDIIEYWTSNSKERVKIFFSYAHEDREYLNEFKDYIKIFERNELVEQWDDNELVVGEKWDSKIKDKIYSADIVIFLLSASSLASDYIYNHELKIAFELNEMDEVYVIPIIIKDCLWNMTEFSEFQILPLEGKAVNSWRLKEEAWTSVARGLKKAIDNIIVAKQESVKDIELENVESSLQTKDILFDEKDLNENKNHKVLLKFLKTYSRWWFNIPRIINWGSERNGFSELKNFTNDELKIMLQELEEDKKVKSKKSAKSKSNNLLYQANY